MTVPAWAAVGIAADGQALAQRYAHAYEIELRNADLAAAVTQYLAIAQEAGVREPGFAARVRLRAALCEIKLGRPSAARETLRELADSRSADEATVSRAQRELRALDEELDRVTIRGRVLDAKGAPVAGASVLVGQWTVEPPMLTATDGTFVAVRRLDELGADGRHYGLIFAEHPWLPLVAFDAVITRGGRTSDVEVSLKPPVTVGGRVTDQKGRGVEGALLSVTGVTQGADPLPLPVDRILTPQASGTNGQFWVGNLGRGISWRFTVRRDGYRLVKPMESLADEDRPYAGEIVLEAISSLSVSGKVVDPAGKPLRATVTAWSMPPDVRKLAETQTDEEGNYAALNLSDEAVTVKATATTFGDGERATAERSFTGVRPGAARTDFEIDTTPHVAPAVELGKAAPELAAIPLGGGTLTLSHCRGSPLILYFWSRQRLLRPSFFAQRLAERYSKRGVRVLCIHDQSGSAADLARIGAELGPSCEMALDVYSPGAASGAMNSLTWIRYGAACGTVALVGRDGTLLMTGLADEPAFQIRMEEAVEEQTAAVGDVASLFPVPVVGVGRPVPAFNVERWVRGDPGTGQSLRSEDLRGKIAIIHFGSVYVAASLRSRFQREGNALGQVLKTYGGRGVTAVWLLPTEEGDEAAGRLAAELVPEAVIGVDRKGESYRALGSGETTGNIVADPRGIVRSVCTDQQLFRTVKDLVVR